MRATTIFVFLVLLFGIYQVGFVTMHAIGTPGNPTPAAVTDPLAGDDSSPFSVFMDFDSATGTLGNSTNTTIIGELLDWDLGGAAMAVLDVTGVDNLAKYMIAFINLLSGFVTAPFTFIQLIGLSNQPIAYLIPVALIVLLMLAIWQIITGRQV